MTDAPTYAQADPANVKTAARRSVCACRRALNPSPRPQGLDAPHGLRTALRPRHRYAGAILLGLLLAGIAWQLRLGLGLGLGVAKPRPPVASGGTGGSP